MSSILTALKKLEDKDFHKEEIRVLSQNASHRHKNARKSFAGFSSGINLRQLLPMAALVSVSGILAWNLFFKNNSVLTDNTLLSHPSSESLVSGSITGTDPPPLSENAPVAHLQIPRKTDVAESSRSKPFSKPETTVQRNTLDKTFVTPPSNNTYQNHRISEKRHTDALRPQIDNTTPPNGQEQLSLQAIAWAKNPIKRMAVINGKILRQGDMLDGTAIHQINENDVVLTKDGYTWRVLFNIR